MGTLDAVLGLQWGDEGKGKLVDIIANSYDAVARFGGGANAGHTIYTGGKKYVFHLIPSAALHSRPLCIIGLGCVLALDDMAEEIETLAKEGIDLTGRLIIDSRTTLLFPYHKFLDGQKESALGDKKVGTTKRGIGPAYAERAARSALRAGDLLSPNSSALYREKLLSLKSEGYEADIDAEVATFERLRAIALPFIADAGALLRRYLKEGKSVLAEGGQAALLDIGLGTYPFVTSSITTVGGIFSGLGVPPHGLDRLIGVVKAYTTRVGAGPFPTELSDGTGEQIRQTGCEFGATTGRPRRTGWLDIPVIRYAAEVNGITEINLTKLDVLQNLPEIKLCTSYKGLTDFPSTIEQLTAVEPIYETLPGFTEDISKVRKIADLPLAALAYVRRIEELIGVTISSVGVGPDRADLATI